MKRIYGYVYKFDEFFGDTTRKIEKEEFEQQLLYMESHPQAYIPVTTSADALIGDLYKAPLKIDGYATLELKDDGVYAYITTNGNLIDKFDDDFILENFNLGMSLVCDNPSFFNSKLRSVYITHLTVGRFMTKHIYKPDKVETVKKN